MIKFKFIFIFHLIYFLSSCSSKPEPIHYGKDNCNYCKMTISDKHFGAELITNKGKIYKFDEISCLISFANEQELDSSKIKEMYFTDYCSKNLLLNKKTAFYMQSDSLKSPMGGNVATFSDKDSLGYYSAKINGKILTWYEVVKYTNEQ